MTNPPSPQKIPNKLYFRIGEVSEITGVQPYTLRHWEMEFPTLSPRKNDAGQRLYSKTDVGMVQEIQRLLHHEGYTTAGAVRLLAERKRTRRGKPAAARATPSAPPPAAKPARAAAPSPGKPSRAAPASGKSSPPPDGAPAAAKKLLALMDANDARLAELLGPDS